MPRERRLLIVDDEANIQRSIKRICRSKGYKVLFASNAEEALALMERTPIEVVVSDQLMPGMNGTEMFAKIKETFPDTVRILLTGFTALEGIATAINDGAVFKILFKPWDDNQLLQVLDEAFQFNGMRESNRQLTEELKALNKDLEQLVEAKTRELSLNVKRLQVSQYLFEVLPNIMIGISDDLIVVEANKVAREVFHKGGLVGLPVVQVLPIEISKFVEESLKCNDLVEQQFDYEDNGIHHRLRCIGFELQDGMHGSLLYGAKVDD